MKALRICYAVLSGAFMIQRSGLKRSFVSISKPLFLNRVIVSESEVITNSEGNLECSLLPDDSRSNHIREVRMCVIDTITIISFCRY